MHELVCSVLQLGQKYPREGDPHIVLDVGLYEERQLMELQDKDTYPLVIRLECVTDQGKTDKHTLQVHMRLCLSSVLCIQDSDVGAELLRMSHCGFHAPICPPCQIFKATSWCDMSLQPTCILELSACVLNLPNRIVEGKGCL